jgi:nitroimidazol reductase NimA-like FMN-containing flavoprotein (pyridoxamine 5'-phosphate oxidase superfamily)
MEIRDLTEQECYAILATTKLARLACTRHNQPYIVPLHVHFKCGVLYGFATLGQKIEWMRENPFVCLEFDDIISEQHWTTMLVFGFYEELPGTAAHEGSRAIAHDLFTHDAAWWEPASIPVGAHPRREPIVFRIQITRISGRRATPDVAPASQLRGELRELAKQGWFSRILRQLAQRQ